MGTIMNMFFSNIFLFIFLAIGLYIFKEYRDLKGKTDEIRELFTKTLDSYLIQKINEAKAIADEIMSKYSNVEEIKVELSKLQVAMDKGMTGDVNQKVKTSNAMNKFKLSKNLKLEYYPGVEKLQTIGTFTEEDMNSTTNGVAIARRDYNALAFRYNEKAGGFPMQYLVKYLGLNQSFVIFDAPKSAAYEEKYEVFEEKEPEINTIQTLNKKEVVEENNNFTLPIPIEEKQEITIEHTDNVLKPSIQVNPSYETEQPAPAPEGETESQNQIVEEEQTPETTVTITPSEGENTTDVQ